MPRRYLSIDEFNTDSLDPAKHTYADPALNLEGGWTVATAGRMIEALPERCIRYSFSDATVGRDMHTILPDAWVTDNFERNPVFLWAHQDDELPVGRVENLATQSGRLVGQVRYAEHDFADTVYQLVRGSFLNATSTGWLPLQWRAANDRNRPGGLDFTRVELLEISQVPVPALPTALVTARSSGIDTRPLFDWAERLLDGGDFAVIPRADLETLRKAARTPLKRRTTKSGAEMTEETPPTPAPAAEPTVKPAPSAQDEPTRGYFALARKLKKRDLCTMADLAYYLAYLENIFDRVAAEAAREDDGSTIPDKLRAWLNDGNRLLLEMAGEETQEQIDGTQDEAASAYYWSAANLEGVIARAFDARGLVRKGKKFSAETVRCMRAVHDHLSQARDQLSTMLSETDDADSEAGDPEADDENSRAARASRAAALKARHTA